MTITTGKDIRNDKMASVKELISLEMLRAEENCLRRKFEEEALVTDFEKGYISAPWVNQEIDPDLQRIAARNIAHYFANGITRVAGIPNCGVPLATTVAQEMGILLAPSRKGSKVPGAWRNPLIVGEETPSFTTGEVSTFAFNSINPGDNLLLVDDFIAKGDTGINIIEILRKKEVRVSFAVYAAKTFQPGWQRIKDMGIDAFYVVGIKAMKEDKHVVLEPPHF